MRYTKRTLVISQANVVDAEQRVARQRDVVEQLDDCRHPSVHATALLLVMEQSLLSMKRFLATVEQELELSMGLRKPKRTKAARRRAEANADQLAAQVVDVLRVAGLDAKHSGAEPRTADPAASIASR